MRGSVGHPSSRKATDGMSSSAKAKGHGKCGGDMTGEGET